MSRVITFSTVFPSYHPRKGERTYFLEQVQGSLYNQGVDLSEFIKYPETHFANNWWDKTPKNHTIRAGNRWKVGDKFSPRVWTGKPYQSKQYQFAPDIEIKKVWDFEMDLCGVYSINKFYADENQCELLAKNDGLTEEDLFWWFMKDFSKPKEFQGQVVCWNESVNY